ncbi:MAG: hypothetical protein ACMUIS_02205 [bacterium]
MESDLKSKSGPVAVWLGAAILTIGFMAMLETNMVSWGSDMLVSAAGIVTALILFRFITTKTHFTD